MSQLSDTNYMSYTTPEQRATLEAGEALGFDFIVEPEQDCYEDVYGEPPPEGSGDFYWVCIQDAHGEHLASCGMIDDSDMRYLWSYVADLCWEATENYRAKRRPGVAGVTCDGRPE